MSQRYCRPSLCHPHRPRVTKEGECNACYRRARHRPKRRIKLTGVLKLGERLPSIPTIRGVYVTRIPESCWKCQGHNGIWASGRFVACRFCGASAHLYSA